MPLIRWLVALALLAPSCAWAQNADQAEVVANCGTPNGTYPTGQKRPITQDTTGRGCGAVSSTVTPGTYTIVALDATSVVTGGTAVSASTAGHHNKGGWIQNPVNASVALCVNEQGTASGTTSSGATTCVSPGQIYAITPSSTSVVSVISSDNTHPFSGQGYN